MDNFNDIKRKIEGNDRVFIEIRDINTGSPIIPSRQRLTGKQIVDQYGSLDNFLQQEIKEKGFDKIQAQLFKALGSGSERIDIAYRLSLSDKKEPEPKQTIEQPVPNNQNTPNSGLNSPMAMGLSFPEMVNLHVDRSRYGDTKRELEEEKRERKRLEKELEDEKEKNRTWERKNDSKEFWGGLVKEIAPAIQGLAMAVKPGLNGPAQSEEYDNGIKGNLIMAIKNSPISDEQGLSAYAVLKAYAEQNQEFIPELHQLFEKHNIQWQQ